MSENILRRFPDDSKRYDECDILRIDEYELREVLFPVEKEEMRRVIAIVIRGRNLRAMAQPLVAHVGEIPVRHLRIALDERSVEGILLHEPKEGAYVEVILGETEQARHPTPFDPSMIHRID
jgi:hypothetical protein